MIAYNHEQLKVQIFLKKEKITDNSEINSGTVVIEFIIQTKVTEC